MYQSPFHLIDAAALSQEPDALRRALALEKKKLLAEFELSNSATIVLDGREIHRQDVLRLFDELVSDSRLRYHRAIWEDGTLRTFLEDAYIEPGARWARNALYEEPGFLQFVSPWFAEATNMLLQAALADKVLPKSVDALAANPVLRLPGDTEVAFRYVMRFFTEKKNELLGIRYRVDSGETVTVREIGAWCGDAQLKLLNLLPESFTSLRYALANTLNNLCVAFDKKKQNGQALAAVTKASRITLEDEELKKLVPSNLRIIRGKASRGWFNIDPETGRKKPKIGLIIALFIIIIRIATAGNSCNQHRPTITEYRNLPTYSYNSEANAKRMGFEALLKTLIKPTPIEGLDTFYDNSQYRLQRPLYAGDDPFKPYFTDGFNDTLRPAAANELMSYVHVANNSNWQAIVLYQSGERSFGSAYVPPHGAYTISYNSHDISLHIYAGARWDDRLPHAVDYYTTPILYSHRIIRGGFRARTPTAYDDTTGTPMFRHKTEHPVTDTMILSNDSGGGLDVQYNPGDG